MHRVQSLSDFAAVSLRLRSHVCLYDCAGRASNNLPSYAPQRTALPHPNSTSVRGQVSVETRVGGGPSLSSTDKADAKTARSGV
jgi:hypothetical protein